jgi:D-alanyl-D-alanine carboxypeptidase
MLLAGSQLREGQADRMFYTSSTVVADGFPQTQPLATAQNTRTLRTPDSTTPRTRSYYGRTDQKRRDDVSVKKRREVQAESMKKRYKTQVKIEPGTFVSIKLDQRDTPATVSRGNLLGVVIMQDADTKVQSRLPPSMG